jgi:hypothetical protein
MDYRCPVCGADLGRRKLTQAVVTQMETECFGCKSAISLNVHWLEEIVVLFSFGAIVVLAAFAYWFQSQGLVITALGAAMLGALALPLLEKTYLRTWPRYVARVH